MPKNKEEKNGSAFPDLTGDGKVTQADILKGRGVFKMDDHRGNNGQVKSPEVFKMAINNQK
jgi:hypothetical protein|tara:strand:+ start:344 stop:526 length:183 start_codon:yes stop_codon:yes gene_type:complete